MDGRGALLVAVVALVALGGCAGLELGATDESGGDVPTLPANDTLEPGTGTTATVVDVVDGDTIDVRYPNGTTDTVRLLGVDTPEVHADNDPAEFEGVPVSDGGRACLEDAGEGASEFAETHLAGAEVRLVVDPTADRRDRYDRLLAYVHVGGADFNYRLVAEGYARVYDSTFDRSDRYYAAESDARNAGSVVWDCRTVGGGGSRNATASGSSPLVVETVQADAPGNDHENPNGEFVTFRNDGDSPLALGGWTVSDEAGHAYTVPGGVALDPGETVTLYSGAGEDTESELYWGADGAIWNNGGDAVIVARDGETVRRYRYG